MTTLMKQQHIMLLQEKECWRICEHFLCFGKLSFYSASLSKNQWIWCYDKTRLEDITYPIIFQARTLFTQGQRLHAIREKLSDTIWLLEVNSSIINSRKSLQYLESITLYQVLDNLKTNSWCLRIYKMAILVIHSIFMVTEIASRDLEVMVQGGRYVAITKAEGYLFNQFWDR